MACRLLNSRTEPHHMIRALHLSCDLLAYLRTSIESIENAKNTLELSHAHGRAVGLGTGLAMANAITRTQFGMMCEVIMRAFEQRLDALTGQGLTASFVDADSRVASGCR